MIEIHSFEAAHYEGDCLLLKKKSSDQFTPINGNQWNLLKSLQDSKDMLSVVLPSDGVAKKTNIANAMDLFKKLHQLGILELQGHGVGWEKGRTAEITLPEKKKLRLDSIDSLGASILGVFAKILSFSGASGVMLLSFVLAGIGLVLFPFESVNAAAKAGSFSYLNFFLIAYISSCAGLSLRAIFQAAYLLAKKRKFSKVEIGLFGPFLCITLNANDICMVGRRARLQMALTSLLSPLTIIPIIYALHVLGFVTLVAAFIMVASLVGVTLLSACPMLDGDLAELSHCIFYPESVERNGARNFRDFLAGKIDFKFPHFILSLFTGLWAFIWVDSVRAFVDSFLNSYLTDLYFSANMLLRMQATLFFTVVYLAVALPFFIFFLNASSRLASKNKQNAKQEKEQSQKLSLEEQMSVLERIPLFAALSDQDRVTLFNEMRSQYFAHGEALVMQGDLGDEFYVLVRGKARARYIDSTEKKHEVGFLQEGDAFGEIALIDDVPRTASIISDGGCHALILKKENFEEFLESVGSADAMKQMIRLTGFLRRHPLFSKLPAKDLALLINSLRFEFVTLNDEAGKEQQGNVYIVYSGKFKVDADDDSIDQVLEAEDFFGYADHSVAKVRVTALEGAGLLCIHAEDFKTLVWQKFQESPTLFL